MIDNENLDSQSCGLSIEDQNEIENLGKKIDSLTWKDAAKIFGENLSTVGPEGYYDFTPKEWLMWSQEQWKILSRGISISKMKNRENK